MLLLRSEDVLLLLGIPGRCSSKINDSLKVLYYLFWILFSSQIDWEALLFASDSERSSKTQTAGNSVQKKELLTPTFPYQRLSKFLKLNRPPNRDHGCSAPVAMCLPVTWWKWRGSIFSNYLAPHWQNRRKCDSGAWFCQGSHFSHHQVTHASESQCHLWCLTFGTATHLWFRMDYFNPPTWSHVQSHINAFEVGCNTRGQMWSQCTHTTMEVVEIKEGAVFHCLSKILGTGL